MILSCYGKDYCMQNQMAQSKESAAYTPPAWDQLPDLGLYMDQVITYMERQFKALYPKAGALLTPAMINNYVKSGLVKRPAGKKYDQEQLAQLIMLCTLKQVASMEEMKQLLTPPDGQDTEQLYESFRGAQANVFQTLLSRPPEPSAMQYAIEAAAFRSLCAKRLAEEVKPPAKPEPKKEKNPQPADAQAQ